MDDQLQELEALESIFYEHELSIESKQDPISFNIHIYLDNDTKNALPINKSDPVGEFTLSITFTPTYPESAPLFKLIDIENISPTDCHLINNLIQETIKDNIGCQMIYSIVMVCKEEIERSVRDRRNLQAKQLDERLRADHEAEVLRSQGTKVTAASFNAWNEKFLIEVRGQKDEFQRADKKDKTMTGRQLFEIDGSLAKSDVGLIADGDITVDVDCYEKIDRNKVEEEDVNVICASFSDDQE